jgi:hypothetical protein
MIRTVLDDHAGLQLVIAPRVPPIAGPGHRLRRSAAQRPRLCLHLQRRRSAAADRDQQPHAAVVVEPGEIIEVPHADLVRQPLAQPFHKLLLRRHQSPTATDLQPPPEHVVQQPFAVQLDLQVAAAAAALRNSFAKFAAMHQASSLVSRLSIERRLGSSSFLAPSSNWAPVAPPAPPPLPDRRRSRHRLALRSAGTEHRPGIFTPWFLGRTGTIYSLITTISATGS